MESIYFNGSLISFFIAALSFYMLVALLYSMVDQEDRTYMDPLSWKLKLLWPFIQIIANFFVIFFPYEMLERTEEKITHSGVSYLLNAEQFIALRIISAIADGSYWRTAGSYRGCPARFAPYAPASYPARVRARGHDRNDDGRGFAGAHAHGYGHDRANDCGYENGYGRESDLAGLRCGFRLHRNRIQYTLVYLQIFDP